MRALVAGGAWEGENGAFVTDSLQSVVRRCQRSLEMATGLEFITMINMLQLAAKADWWVLLMLTRCVLSASCSILRTNRYKSVANVYNLHLMGMDGGPSLSTFRTWVGIGTKFASIAGAGELPLTVMHGPC